MGWEERTDGAWIDGRQQTGTIKPPAPSPLLRCDVTDRLQKSGSDGEDKEVVEVKKKKANFPELE